MRADIVKENRGEILRLVASLNAGHAAPAAMPRKLAAYERQNQLAVALQEVGKIERTLFMLDWLENPDLHRRCQAGINKGEPPHALTQAICTFRQGRIAESAQEAQQYRASGEPAPDDLLAHTSPVGCEHIAFSGDFLWDRAAAIPAGRRELNLGRRMRGTA